MVNSRNIKMRGGGGGVEVNHSRFSFSFNFIKCFFSGLLSISKVMKVLILKLMGSTVPLLLILFHIL